MLRLLAAATLTAATLAAAAVSSTAVAAPVCQDAGTKLTGTHVCLTLPEGDTVVCSSASVDPSRQTMDDATSFYFCLVDLGGGYGTHHCLATGRRVITCSR